MDVKRKVDMIRVNPQDWPDGTPAWKAEDPELGYDVIPAGRYTSAEFMKLESKLVAFKVIADAHQAEAQALDESLQARLKSLTEYFLG